MPDAEQEPDGSFGPKEIERLVAAYHGALGDLTDDRSLAAQGAEHRSAREIRRLIAGRIIEEARRGELDVARLKAVALASLRRPVLVSEEGHRLA